MEIKLFDAEYRFMEILWEHAPINSTELVKLCNQKLGWKKSTTYTTIKRLSERKIVNNKNAIVNFLVTKDEARAIESKAHLNKLYSGSLKMFLASFLDKEKLSADEAIELQKLIEKKICEDA